jgi:hypothetical protein
VTVRRALTAAVLLAAALTGCTPNPPATIQAGPLAALTVAAEDPTAHYARADWGTWAHRGQCDTRENVLTAQGAGVVVDGACRPGCPAAAPPCWTSPYDGVTTADPATLQIDHLVPLAEAAHSGAADWPPAQRHGYYNDPRNLVAVTAHANTSKGDRDPAQWKPTARDSWCAYATGWTSVKAKYGLTADRAEMDALGVMLATCPAGTP